MLHQDELTLELPYSLGSPANPFGKWIAWTLRQSLAMQPVNSSAWISTETWTLIHREILKQCDALDGVRRTKRGTLAHADFLLPGPFRFSTSTCMTQKPASELFGSRFEQELASDAISASAQNF